MNIASKLRIMAANDGCDGEPWDTMQAASDEIESLRQQRYALAEALKLSSSLNAAFIDGNESVYDLGITATNTESGDQYALSVRDVIEKSIEALAAAKGEKL